MIELDKLEKIKLRRGISEKSWNLVLPVPLKEYEVVSIHPDQSDVNKPYVKIIHSDCETVSVFTRAYFE
jgi:hypothetical protein